MHGVKRANDMHAKSSASSIATDKECIAGYPECIHLDGKPPIARTAGTKLRVDHRQFGQRVSHVSEKFGEVLPSISDLFDGADGLPRCCKNLNMTAEQAMREIWGAVPPDCGPENYDFIVADVVTKAAAAALTRQIDVVFDGPPGPNAGRFVEVEDESGRSVDVGKWVERSDGYFALRIRTPVE